MSKAFVIMANDYPVGVFDNLDVTQQICDHLNKLDADRVRAANSFGRRCYYRLYEFEMNEKRAGMPL